MRTEPSELSERHLDEFWHSILRLDIIGPLSPYAMDLITDIPLNRTTTPVPRILADRQEISTTSSDRSDSPSRFGELVMPRAKADLPPRDHQIGSQPKIKTRGRAGPQTAEDAPPEESKRISGAIFKVDVDSMAVVSLLFFLPGNRHQPSNVRWHNVLTLFSQMGFEIEQLWGSA